MHMTARNIFDHSTRPMRIIGKFEFIRVLPTLKRVVHGSDFFSENVKFRGNIRQTESINCH